MKGPQDYERLMRLSKNTKDMWKIARVNYCICSDELAELWFDINQAIDDMDISAMILINTYLAKKIS